MWRVFLLSMLTAVSSNNQASPLKNPKCVALTFDDGPSPLTTPLILSTLKEHNVKATFFMLGEHIEKYPHLVKAVINDGHEIGNHSYSHPVLSKKTKEQVQKELEKTQTLLMKLGVRAAWFRPPYGRTNQIIKDISTNLGMDQILWTVDSEDWRNPNRIMNNVHYKLKPGGVVLMHDTKRGTSNILPTLIVFLKDQGYDFVTLTQRKKYKD